MRLKGATPAETSQSGEDAWVEIIINKVCLTEEFQKSCAPGHYNNDGRVNVMPRNNFYGGGPIGFYQLMKKWRSKGKLEGLELTE